VPEICLATDYIIRREEVAERMYFIKSGKVQILATDEKTVIAQQY
jgi:CRP-like cAMP-binding protein